MSTGERVTGKVIKVHGVRGEFIVDIRTDEPDIRFAQGKKVTLRTKTDVRHGVIVSARGHLGRLIVKLDITPTREAAEELRSALFVIPESELGSPVNPEEFYDHQLEGLRVLAADGSEFGVVTEILHLPAGDTVSFKDPTGQERLIPFTYQFVPVVDVVAGHIQLDPPEGLWEDE